MSSVRAVLAVVTGLVAAASLGGCVSVTNSSSEASTDRPNVHATAGGDAADARGTIADGPVHAQALRVIDGDTIEVLYRGRRHRVRLLGIDAPERTTLRTGQTECGGEAASRAADALFSREQDVTLESDPGQDRYDTYGRLLAYVTSDGDDRTWQEQLLAQGWAKVFSLRRNPIERLDAFEAAAAQAKADGVGVWRQCDGDFRRPD